MLLLIVRAFYAALLIGVALFAFNLFEEATLESGMGVWTGMYAAGAVFALGALVLFLDIRQRRKNIGPISAIFFGLMMGMLLGWLLASALTPVIEAAFSSLTRMQMDRLQLLVRLVLTVLACYVTISTLVQTKDDFRFIIPYVEFARQVRGGRPLVLDTSVIIDGRIADLCDTRIIDTTLVVPRFVLQELQGIADSSDKLKRNRGRRGLDILKRLQNNPRVELEMAESPPAPGSEKIRVDERLVLFAKGLGARVVTNDFNLNKIAQIQGVDVINLNEVTNALKTVALPGEYLTIRVVKPGDQIGQGVAYLDDGTMIVVEQGRNLIGQEVSIVVTSVLQTPAGRMIFGRPENRPSSGSFTPVSGASGSHAPVHPPATSGTRPSGTSPSVTNPGEASPGK
ncbi:MAG: hypothetical protein LC104_10160 [Bacteroidales bacterium]|nr:hypothetical protein [Bacteroidales bacterium]